ncbi:M20/M25/M40 family metallo-hydrolase [Spongorhabdus nitratireducens]
MITNTDKLQEFISIPSVDNHPYGNKQAIDFVSTFLSTIGFDCQTEGASRTDQPVLVCRHPGRNSNQKIVIYGHYDVAPVGVNETWKYGDPFTLKETEGRFFCRGIADNKGPLWARLEAVAELFDGEAPCPEILWLIQGEEEVTSGERVAKEIFSHHIERFGGNLFIEETGFNNIDTGAQIAFLWSPSLSQEALRSWEPLLQASLNKPLVEYRHLNKFNGIEACPLLGNLPDKAVYIGFGPNDRLHQIHRENESLNIERLDQHKKQFKEFLSQYARVSCNPSE